MEKRFFHFFVLCLDEAYLSLLLNTDAKELRPSELSRELIKWDLEKTLDNTRFRRVLNSVNYSGGQINV